MVANIFVCDLIALINTYFNVVTRLCPQLESIRNKMLINPALFKTLQFTPRETRVNKTLAKRLLELK